MSKNVGIRYIGYFDHKGTPRKWMSQNETKERTFECSEGQIQNLTFPPPQLFKLFTDIPKCNITKKNTHAIRLLNDLGYMGHFAEPFPFPKN